MTHGHKIEVQLSELTNDSDSYLQPECSILSSLEHSYCLLHNTKCKVLRYGAT